jgi:hypothetical protein
MVEFIDDVFEVTFRGENVILTWPNGRSRAMPISTAVREYEIMGRALAAREAAAGSVVQFKRKRGH